MRKLFGYLFLVLTGTTVGVTGGILGKKYLASPEVTVILSDPNSMKMDCEKIVKDVESYKGNKDVTEAFSAATIVNYALEKYRRCENSYSFVYGVADTIVKQDIRGCSIKNGDNYFEESISKSKMVSLGSRMLQEGKCTDVTLYSADKSSITIEDQATTLTYSGENQVFTSEEYVSAYGRTLDEMFIYLISDKTVTSSEINKTEEGYTVKLCLNAEVATYFYKIQMKTISSLDKLPSFSDVTLTYTLTNDLMLKHLSTDENYVATMVVNASIHGTLETDYYPNQYLKIPSLSENLTYNKGEN